LEVTVTDSSLRQLPTVDKASKSTNQQNVTVTYEWNGDPNWRSTLAQVYALILAAAERERERAVPDDRPA
jgi:hypothetical protein